MRTDMSNFSGYRPAEAVTLSRRWNNTNQAELRLKTAQMPPNRETQYALGKKAGHIKHN